MKSRKKEPTPIAKIRKSGFVSRSLSPASRAGRYWRGAYYMLPKFNLWIKLSCLVALLGALACLLIVFTRPRPILLVSFPDGTTLCSLPPLDPSTGRILPRPSQEEEMCAMLAKRSGRGTDKDNAEFAKVSQVEPPAQERSDLQAPVEPAPTQASPSAIPAAEQPAVAAPVPGAEAASGLTTPSPPATEAAPTPANPPASTSSPNGGV